MSDIFISYSSQDVERAKQLAEALQREGWSVWWDRSILPGKIFDKVIEAELTASRCVIVLWSQHAVESPWVRAEAEEAMKKGLMLPALLEPLQLPLVFRQYQAASLYDWDGDPQHAGLQHLLQALRSLLDNTASTRAQPGSQPTRRAPTQTITPALAARRNRHAGTKLAWGLVLGLSAALAYVLFESQQRPDPPPPELGSEQDREQTPGLAPPPRVQMAQAPEQPTDEPASAMTPATEPELTTDVIAGLTRGSTTTPTDQPDTQAGEPDPAPATTPAVTTTTARTRTADTRTSAPTAPATASRSPATTTLSNTRAPSASSLGVGAESTATTPTQPASAARQVVSAQPARTEIATAAPAADPAVKILTAIWAMPSDSGVASDARVERFSQQVSDTLTHVLQEVLPAPADFEYLYLDKARAERLVEEDSDDRVSRALCRSKQVDLIISGYIGGAEYVSASYGYALTRDPQFAIYDCKADTKTTHSDQIAARNNESFPFAQDIRRVFRVLAERQAAQLQR